MTGLPGTKMPLSEVLTTDDNREDWLYTDITVLKGILDVSAETATTEALYPDIPGYSEIIIRNGKPDETSDLFRRGIARLEIAGSDGADSSSLTARLIGKHVKYRLCISVLANHSERIHLVQSGTGPAATSGLSITLKTAENASLEVLHTCNVSDPDHLSVSDIAIESNAASYVSMISWSGSGHALSRIGVRSKRDSNVNLRQFSAVPGIFRSETKAHLTEPGANFRLHSLHITSGTAISDMHTQVFHEASHTSSEEECRFLLSDSGQGVFYGQIYVEKDTEQVVADQLSKALLLDNTAGMASRPHLRIAADDVRCSHGSSAGSLDEEAVFYLRSRGISETQAKALLVAAFSDEILGDILPEYKDYLINQIGLVKTGGLEYA